MLLTTKNGAKIYPIGYGTMGLSGIYQPTPTRDEAIRLVLSALQQGCNLLDTAKVYGSGKNGGSESIIGAALSQCDIARESTYISTKGGLCFEEGQFALGATAAQLRVDCEESLRHLKTDYIDCYFLHRIDPETPLEESLSALVELQREGKIRHIGLSEVDAETIEHASGILGKLGSRLDAVQNEYSLISRDDEQNTVLITCARYNIAYMAYSPTGRGLLAHPDVIEKTLSEMGESDIRKLLPRYSDPNNLEKNKALVARLGSIAAEKRMTVTQLALAWLVARGKTVGAEIIPIPGTKTERRIAENCFSGKIILTSADMEQIESAFNPDAVCGVRWPDGIAFSARRPAGQWNVASADNRFRVMGGAGAGQPSHDQSSARSQNAFS